MIKPVVFLVEDNELVREILVTGLVEEGYTLITAASAAEAVEKFPAARADIVLLDLLLPDGNGLTLLKGIREKTDIPVIVISGKAEMVDKVVGLEMGADDYVGKPVQMREIAARVKAQLRRYKAMTEKGAASAPARKKEASRIRFGDWILDRPRFQAFGADGAPAGLTVREFRLLEVLVLEPDRVLSRAQLLDKLQADNHEVSDRAVDVQILRIRRKIRDKAGPGEMIRAVRGVGYMFVAETEALPSAG